MKENDFYIGWRSGNAPRLKRFTVVFFTSVTVLFLLFAVLYTRNEKNFIGSYFEYGTLTEVTGQLVNKPVWGLRTEENGIIQTIPLVGFGKFGAEEPMRKILAESPELGEGSTITLRGTLFYYRDRKWMELTEMENSLVSKGENEPFQVNIDYQGERTLEGEIVDPKCFFGVMNPAVKTVHRSCAIRCIDGGIPPLLAIRENGEFVDYYFLINKYGVPLIDEVLPYVGIPARITGEVTAFDDWKILQTDKEHIAIAGIITAIDRNMAICED